MLIRRHSVKFTFDDEILQFIISNSMDCRLQYYKDALRKEECDAPGLTIKLRSHGREKDEPRNSAIWRDFTSKDPNGPSAPDEILNALRGEESDWRLVRCAVCSDHLLFLCVNPERLKNDRASLLFNDRYGLRIGSVTDMESGVFWGYWRYKSMYDLSSHDVDIISQGGERYTISGASMSDYELSVLDFIEYLPDGKISRISHVEYTADEERSKKRCRRHGTMEMEITECSY